MNNKKCPNCGFINFYQMRLAVNAKQVSTWSAILNHTASRRTALDRATTSTATVRCTKKQQRYFNQVLAGVGALIVFAVIAVGAVSIVLVAKSHSRIAWQEFPPGASQVSVS